VRRTGGFHPRRVLRYDRQNPRQPVGAGFELRAWSLRDSSRRNHGWQEVPHSSSTHTRSDDRPGKHRAGRADTDSLGLSDRVADTVFDPDCDADGRITHGDSHSDIDTDRDATDIDSYGDADTDRNATDIDSHGDADTDAAHGDSVGESYGDGDPDTVGDSYGDGDGDSDGDTDGSAPARSFPLLQGRDNKGLTLVHT
jgi:hypothetical protein